MKNLSKKELPVDRIEIKIYEVNMKDRFKSLCKKNDTTMTEVLEKAIRKYIQDKG